VAGIGYDAIALLVVRLASDQPAGGNLHWHDWKDAVGAEPDGVSEHAAKYPNSNPPFKRFPGNGSRYFSPHVERALFPSSGQAGGARWVCCPDDLHLDLLQFGQRTARIELLERLTSPIDRGGTLGLIHLSLAPGDEEDVPDTLSWASAIRSPLLRSNNPNSLSLRHGDHETELESRPLERLVEELFGDPHEDLDRHLYSAFWARYPPEIHRDVEAQRRWRIALATRSYKLDSDRLDSFDPLREERQTLRFGDTTGLVLGNCTVLANEHGMSGESFRSFRSYWTESLVFGLLQQDAIAEFQRRLAELGPSPHRERNGRLRALHDDWLSFRNQLWWSQLSTVADPPQALLPLLQQEQGTGRLFLDLEGDMATYNDLHHRDVEDRQARALANLQVYGSAIAVLSTLGTLYALLDAHGVLLAILLVAALVLSFSVLQLVRAKVERA
jgi:hypothetical protein